jgi:hypothetical protein
MEGANAPSKGAEAARVKAAEAARSVADAKIIVEQKDHKVAALNRRKSQVPGQDFAGGCRPVAKGCRMIYGEFTSGGARV